MIKATTMHHLTLETTDERTAHLANIIHNMNEWYSTGLITDDTFVHIHDILRANIGTENYLCVVIYSDLREESNEYHMGVVEFPEKADGAIHLAKKGEEDNEFFLLTEEETEEAEKAEETKEVAHAVFDSIGFENTTDKKEQN